MFTTSKRMGSIRRHRYIADPQVCKRNFFPLEQILDKLVKYQTGIDKFKERVQAYTTSRNKRNNSIFKKST